MKTVFLLAALVASATALDIKEKLQQIRDPANVNPEVSNLMVSIFLHESCILVSGSNI